MCSRSIPIDVAALEFKGNLPLQTQVFTTDPNCWGTEESPYFLNASKWWKLYPIEISGSLLILLSCFWIFHVGGIRKLLPTCVQISQDTLNPKCIVFLTCAGLMAQFTREDVLSPEKTLSITPDASSAFSAKHPKLLLPALLLGLPISLPDVPAATVLWDKRAAFKIP